MKFWDRVLTVFGPGNLVAMGEGGLALVAIRKQDVVGLVCLGPCLNVLTRLIDAGAAPDQKGDGAHG